MLMKSLLYKEKRWGPITVWHLANINLIFFLFISLSYYTMIPMWVSCQTYTEWNIKDLVEMMLSLKLMFTYYYAN